MQAQFTLIRRSAEQGPGQEAQAVQLMQRFEYLLHPTVGYLPRLLRSGVPLALQQLSLSLFESVFSWRCCPFVSAPELVDAYIHTHYAMVAKVLCSQNRDSDLLAMCASHVRVLLAFAVHRTPAVVAVSAAACG